MLSVPAHGGTGRFIEVTRLLIEAGLSVRVAKDASDQLRDRQAVYVDLPAVADFAAFKLRLEKERLVVQRLAAAPDSVDVKALRERLRLSQSEFAGLFRFGLDTVQNWEQGRTRPDRAAATLLDMINRNPQGVVALLVEN